MKNIAASRPLYSNDKVFVKKFYDKTEIWSSEIIITDNNTSDKYQYFSNDFSDFISQMWVEFVKYTTHSIGSKISNYVILKTKNQRTKFTMVFLRTRDLIQVYAALFGFTGEIGLDYGMGLARNLKGRIGKLPTARELKSHYPGILNAINSGYWIEYGISRGSYNDFMKLTFALVHQKSHCQYKGQNGLLFAKDEVIQYKMVLGTIPTYKQISTTFGGIINAINEEYWLEFGIRKGKFNDFLIYCFGVVNQFQKKKGIYRGKLGLDLAQQQVKSLREIAKKIPIRKIVEKQHRGIIYAIRNGFWENFGVRKGSYNDFLMLLFGKINKRTNGYYKNKKGLIQAIRQYKSLKKLLGAQPTYNQIYHNHGGIITAIRNNYWIEYQVHGYISFVEYAETWEELITDPVHS